MANKIIVKQINLQHCIAATSLIGSEICNMQTKKPNQMSIVLIQEP